MKARKICFPDVTFGISLGNGRIAERSAREQLIGLLSQPDEPGQAVNVKWMRDRIRLVEDLEAGDGAEFVASEDQWKMMVQAVNKSAWLGLSREALALADAVEGAELVTVAEQEAESAEGAPVQPGD